MTPFLFYPYDKYRSMVKKEEDDLKVPRHLMDFKEDKDSKAGQPGEDEMDTGLIEVEPDMELL